MLNKEDANGGADTLCSSVAGTPDLIKRFKAAGHSNLYSSAKLSIEGTTSLRMLERFLNWPMSFLHSSS